jgi:hypothetical protein
MSKLVLALVSALAGPAFADQPLAPPADYVSTTDGVTLSAHYAADQTRVTAPGGVDWIIPRWLRFAYPSPDGHAVLALADTGNLIGTNNPDQIVLTLFRSDASDPLEAALSALMDPAALRQTMSGYAWMDGVVWENQGWTLTLTDGGIIRINPQSGVFTRQRP